MELVKSVSIQNLLNQRAAAVERLAEAKRLYDEADQILQSIGLVRVLQHMRFNQGRDYDLSDSEYVPTVSNEIDAKVWDLLLKESGLRTFMNAASRDAWDKQISTRKTPPLTPENLQATFQSLYQSRADMFELGVIDIFKALSWDYKTNNPCRFSKRIILGGCGHPSWNLDHRAANKLDDLERVFNIMDSKPEPDHRNGWYTRMPSRCIEAESEYFHVKRFKNGNSHITFLRPDLVEKMNLIIAKHYPGALPARV